MRRSVIFSVLLLASAVTYLVAQQNPPPGQQPGQTNPPGDSGMRTGQTSANHEREFVKEQFLCNLFEIEESRLATERATNTEVKDFAKKMIDAHTKANQELQTLAKNMNIDLPSQMEPWQNALLDKVKTTPNDQLGHQYMYCQVGRHHTAVLMNRCAANKFQDGEIKSLAQRTSLELKQHQQRAESIAEKLVNERDTKPLADTRMP